MNYISKRINSSFFKGIFNLPPSLRDKEVEVLIMPIEETEKVSNGSESMLGILNEFSNPLKIENESTAWNNFVKEKYADS